MEYIQEITLKNGAACTVRSGTAADGAAVLSMFIQTHGETDFLTSYPDENRMDDAQESEFLVRTAENPRAAELLAVVDGAVVGLAGVTPVGTRDKLHHRATFGISVLQAYWGLGIGRALTEACIECARRAGYTQLELEVVADNAAAVALYERVGFQVYGRNPKGFRPRTGGWQELILMRRALDGEA